MVGPGNSIGGSPAARRQTLNCPICMLCSTYLCGDDVFDVVASAQFSQFPREAQIGIELHFFALLSDFASSYTSLSRSTL